MGLFSSSKSKSKSTNIITNARIGASGGSLVADDGARIDIRSTSSDPAVLRDAIKQSVALASTAIETATRQAEAATRSVIDANTSARTAEQELLSRAIAGEATAGGEILRTLLILAAIAAGGLVLWRWGARA